MVKLINYSLITDSHICFLPVAMSSAALLRFC